MDAIGQLTGGVAHDFNNLLMAVLSSLELMRKRLPDDPKLLGLLENAVQGAQRGAALATRMLAFARRQVLKQEAVDIPTLVRGMRDLLQRSIGPAITIETRFPLVVDKAFADPNQMELALLNLVVNARYAIPNGGRITIAVRQGQVPDIHAAGLKSGPYICLSVSDNGSGMDEETLGRATEPFFTTKGPGKGTGLGLPMVHGIAEQSGGRFILHSRAGEGTTAEIWLPVAPAETPADYQQLPTASAPPEASRGLVVVVVDDDTLVLMNTHSMLEDLGHIAVSVSSGREALDVLRRRKDVDLVVTDHAMPQMTGLALADAIRKEWTDLPVILATGYAEMEGGSVAGWQKLSKQFTEAELDQAIRDAVRPARRQFRRANPTVSILTRRGARVPR